MCYVEQSDAGCSAVIEDLVRRLKADSPDQLTAIIAAVPEAELRDRLNLAASSTPPPVEAIPLL